MERKLLPWGALLVLLAAGITAVSLPLLTSSTPPRRLPARLQRTTRAPPRADLEEPPPHLDEPAVRGELLPASDDEPRVCVLPPGATRPSTPVMKEPIIDLRHTQGHEGIPQQPASRPVNPDARQDEFDRSRQARDQGVRRFGGTPQTEGAVEAGLAWLAAHQSADGIWDRFRFADLDPRDDRCGGEAILRTETSLEAGLTGLCLLAFLGAGYTDEAGPYQPVVRKAVDALLARQGASGGFGPGPNDGMAGYNDSLATFGLAEYFAMTRAPHVAKPLQRAVDRLVGSQQALGGWDYLATPNSGRNDTSITAWTVQALHACAAARLDVPRGVLVKAALHFARAAGPDGRVRYADAGTGLELDANGLPRYRFGPAMTAAGLTCEQLLGWRLDGPLAKKQAAWLFSQPPSTVKFRGQDRSELHSENYWYYGTIAMFQRGGAEWDRWNNKLRDTLLTLQNREKTTTGKKRAAYGSWDPYGEYFGKWGKMGSRVYTTAICVLTLEIYYRHTPAYLSEDVLVDAGAWREYLAGVDAPRRREAVRCLAALRWEIGEPVLVDLLDAPQAEVALAAAEALAWNDSPMGLGVLEEAVSKLPPWGRHSTEQALQRARDLAKLPPAEGVVRAVDPPRRTVALELPRAYAGMSVTVRRGEVLVGRLRVTRRYAGHPVVIAEMLGAADALLPVPGDIVQGR